MLAVALALATTPAVTEAQSAAARPRPAPVPTARTVVTLPLRLVGDSAAAARVRSRNPDASTDPGWIEVWRRGDGQVEVRAHLSAPGEKHPTDSVVALWATAAAVRRWLQAVNAPARALAGARCAAAQAEGLPMLAGRRADRLRTSTTRRLRLTCGDGPVPLYAITVVGEEGQDGGGLVTTSAQVWPQFLDGLAAALGTDARATARSAPAPGGGGR